MVEPFATYTDGLVESRSLPVDRGMAELREAPGLALADPAIPLASRPRPTG